MYEGRTVFAQPMDQLPRHTFRRLVRRYAGNRRVKTFGCWDQFLSMAFAQLTYRESLRDVEACLGAVPEKLYHLGFRTRADLRPDHQADRHPIPRGLTPSSAARRLPRPRHRQEARLPHQRFHAATAHGRQPVPPALARRTVLQADQAASQDQGVLRDLGQCREDADLGRNLGLPPGCLRPKAARDRARSLHNSTEAPS